MTRMRQADDSEAHSCYSGDMAGAWLSTEFAVADFCSAHLSVICSSGVEDTSNRFFFPQGAPLRQLFLDPMTTESCQLSYREHTAPTSQDQQSLLTLHPDVTAPTLRHGGLLCIWLWLHPPARWETHARRLGWT